MKVSVQIPVYNQEQYVAKAIHSALNQDYECIEVVVLDDCSIDNTYEVAKAIDSVKLKVYRNNINLGRTGNYRKLLYDLVTGEYVVNLDGDDYFTDLSFISKAVTAIRKEPGIVFYQACLVAENRGTIHRFRHYLLGNKNRGLVDGITYFENFHLNNFFGHLSTVYNVAIARHVGFYEYRNLNSDAESMLKLSFYGNVYLDNAPVGCWCIHGNNASAGFLSNNGDTLESFIRLRQYAIPFIGMQKAEAWYQKAITVNRKYVATETAKAGFSSLLKYCLHNKYFNTHIGRLLLKTALNRILPSNKACCIY